MIETSVAYQKNRQEPVIILSPVPRPDTYHSQNRGRFFATNSFFFLWRSADKAGQEEKKRNKQTDIVPPAHARLPNYTDLLLPAAGRLSVRPSVCLPSVLLPVCATDQRTRRPTKDTSVSVRLPPVSHLSHLCQSACCPSILPRRKKLKGSLSTKDCDCDVVCPSISPAYPYLRKL